MDKKKFTNEELDIAGREVIKASMISGDELDRIVSSPMLFSSIKRRIEADRPQQTPSFFERWAGLPILNWSRAVAIFAVAVIFLAGTVTVFVLVKRNTGTSSTLALRKDDTPLTVKPGAPQVSLPAFVEGDLPAGIVPVSERKGAVRAQRTVVKHTAARRTVAPQFEAEGDFYPVTFGGTAEEMSQGGQIVRTEIPRSSLLAMGMDMPIESANEKVKTDLLLGPDGVVRGVRIVK
jgi:hypothetical protein